MSSANGNGRKTYRGKSLEEVIPKIRAELGEDAIVLRRRDGLVGGVGGFFQRPFVEVEAQAGGPRLDVYDEEPIEEALPGTDFDELLADLEVELPALEPPASPEETFEPDLALELALPESAPPPVDAKAERLVDELHEAGLSRELAESLVAEAAQHLAPFAARSSLRTLTRRALAARIPVAPSGARVVAFAGAGGSGKSRCAELLAAAYAAASDLDAVLLSFQGGETAELDGVTALSAGSTAEARAALAPHRERALIAIDTPSAAREAAALAGQLKRIGGVEVHATLPATLSRRAAQELLDRLAPFKPACIALTHTDETEHVGPALDLAIAAGLPLSFVADDAGLAPADPARLASGVLP